MEPNNEQLFSEMETDAIGEIMNISLGSSATSVSTLLDRPVTITTPRVQTMRAQDFEFNSFEPAVGVEINYVSGLSGKNIMILKESDIKVIVGLLLQTDYSDQPFVMDEMSVGAICEVMNQMMGASSTALSQFLNRPINISPPNSFSIDNTEQFKSKYFESDDLVVAVYFNLMIGDMVNSEFISIISVDLAKELVAMFGFNGEEQPEEAAAPAAPQAPAQQAAPAPQQAQAPVQQAAAPAPVPAPVAQAPAPAYAAPVQQAAPAPQPQMNYTVTQAPMQSFDAQPQPEVSLNDGQNSNLNMILSVPLEVTVEIGRTTKKIRDILDFTSGTIVELDKQAGSHVDVYVNGKAIAQGDVVVVDDFYGVRITNVISNSEIINSL